MPSCGPRAEFVSGVRDVRTTRCLARGYLAVLSLDASVEPVIPVYVGLGANLGDRELNLRRALGMLAEADCHVLSVSPLYETEPGGVLSQPRFLNAAAALTTALAPHVLLAALKRIETAMGRRVTVRYGPRPIDLDLLLYADLRIQTPNLTVPHPGLVERFTVLVPLCDIAPDVVHPGTRSTATQHLQALGAPQGIAPYPPGLAS